MRRMLSKSDSAADGLPPRIGPAAGPEWRRRATSAAGVKVATLTDQATVPPASRGKAAWRHATRLRCRVPVCGSSGAFGRVGPNRYRGLFGVPGSLLGLHVEARPEEPAAPSMAAHRPGSRSISTPKNRLRPASPSLPVMYGPAEGCDFGIGAGRRGQRQPRREQPTPQPTSLRPLRPEAHPSERRQLRTDVAAGGAEAM